MSINTYILVGLRNPGEEYELTRHNVGALSLEYCMAQWQKDARYENVSRKKSKLYESWTYRYWIRDTTSIDICLVFPATYMNLSGSAVKSFVGTQNDEADKIGSVWVFHDDIDLMLGSFKIARNISSAGHKGVQNVIEQLGTKDFVRFRIGILPVEGKKTSTDAFVLKKFGKKEREALNSSVFPLICDAIGLAFASGIDRAQNIFNKRANEKLPGCSLPV
ncbi:peptidyl-tRNA hydrolase [Candidatus Uhrbacteria bacterium]|nr:peptidyl-tRNA hydrolase [Candidatus Uhrbacteria bacterium]